MSEEVKPWNMIDGSPKAPDELAESRLKICQTCEYFKQRFQRCSKCGCFMTMKTQLEHAYCPENKW
jgi:hypothetical protein